MSVKIVVAGTDTGVGKTGVAAGLTAMLDGFYCKPVQAGLDEKTDSQTVASLTRLPRDRILDEACSVARRASHPDLSPWER